MNQYKILKGDMNMADNTLECQKRKPHWGELVGAFLVFALGITGGGLTLGFLTTSQSYEFDTVASGKLNITDESQNQTQVESYSGPTSSSTCLPFNNPDDVELNKVKMALSTAPGEGFLAAGIIAIAIGVAGFSHLVHLGRLWALTEAA